MSTAEKRPQTPAEKLFQGPIVDALTHVGQIAMLCCMAGVPMKGENYYADEITVGRVGAVKLLPASRSPRVAGGCRDLSPTTKTSSEFRFADHPLTGSVSGVSGFSVFRRCVETHPISSS